jgi:flagellin-like hook-associated protein FlgL
MQLSRLFHRSGRAIWLIVLVPLLAVGGAVAVVATSAPDRQTLATVSVIAPEGGSTAAVITQAVDGFRSTVSSDTVVQLAAQKSGASINPGRDIKATRVGTSNLVELHVRTQPGEDGEAVVRALVAQTNEALYSSSLASLQARVKTAERRYDEALAERDKETARTGLLLPIEAYRAKASEVTQLRVALATGGGDVSVDRAAVQAALARSQKSLERIGESVTAFESLEDSVSRARAELGAAHQEIDNVDTRLSAATDDQSVTISAPTEQSMRTTVIRAVIAALVLGAALGAALALVIGLIRRPRAPKSAHGARGSTRDQRNRVVSARSAGDERAAEELAEPDAPRDRKPVLW